jgi:uncharacterized protein YggT (Ycf19 family)
MNTNDKVEADEFERLREHEAVKGEVRTEMHGEIARRVEATPADQAEAAEVARRLKQTAIREIASTEGDINRARTVSRISEFIDYAFYLVYGIIGLEILMKFVGARSSSGITQFVSMISRPFLGIFSGVLPNPAAGEMRLMLSYVMAVIIYVLIHVAVNGLMKLVANNRTQGI